MTELSLYAVSGPLHGGPSALLENRIQFFDNGAIDTLL